MKCAWTHRSARIGRVLSLTPQVWDGTADAGSMRPVTLLAVVALLAAVFAAGAVAQTPSSGHRIPGHTKRQAELNVLHAVRVFRRWGVPFLDRKTNTIRTNTTVACAGVARGTKPLRFASFVCTARYQTFRVRLRYIAFTGNGFGMKRLTR